MRPNNQNHHQKHRNNNQRRPGGYNPAHSNGHNNHRRPTNSRNQSYDSNGPEVKVRGTSLQIFEKYQTLARDAQSNGDYVLAENYFQHGEHYARLNAEAIAQEEAQRAQFQPRPQFGADGEQPSMGNPFEATPDSQPRFDAGFDADSQPAAVIEPFPAVTPPNAEIDAPAPEEAKVERRGRRPVAPPVSADDE